MSYIADKKEKCPGFFLVAILHTTCRVDKLLGFCLKNEFHRAAKEKERLHCVLGFWFFLLDLVGVFVLFCSCFIFGLGFCLFGVFFN